MLHRLVVVGLVGVSFFSQEADAGIWKNGPQHNGIQANGIQANGIQANGIQANGIQANGIQANGIQANGTQLSGVTYDGVSLSGTQISYVGQGTSAFPYSCDHREDAVGNALADCSPCSKLVGDADPYCRGTYWDGL